MPGFPAAIAVFSRGAAGRWWRGATLALAALLGQAALGSSGGISSASFSSASASCATAGCHATQAGSATTSITLQAYTPGTFTYRFRVSVSSSTPSGTRGGFNVHNSSGTGTFSASSAGTGPSRVLSGEATHMNKDARSWDFLWTRGSQLTQASTNAFNVCAQAVNNDAGVGGDSRDCILGTLVRNIATPPGVAPSAAVISPLTGQSTTVPNAGQSVRLNANPSGGNGALTYAWSAPVGITLSSNTAVNPTFTAPTVASNTNYTFTVTATDSKGQTATDSVIVTVNASPSASAGTDQTVRENTTLCSNTATTVTLTGSTADRASSTWVQVGGASVGTITNSTLATATFTAPAQGLNGQTNYTFRYTVTDSNRATDFDDMIVTVRDRALDSANPTVDADTASAGNTRNVNEGDAVGLSGTGTDTDGCGAVTYSWTQLSGTSVALANATTATPSFTAPDVAGTVNASATLVFQVTVTDPSGDIAQDTVSVVVNNGPVANAGPDQSVTESTLVTLASASSFDPGGGAITRNWVQTGGTAVTLSSASATSPTFTAPARAFDTSEVLTFQLTVTDSGGKQATDTVLITVNDVAVGDPAPVANAGTDVTRNEGVAVSLGGSATDNGSIASVSWVQQANGAPTVVLTGANTLTPSFTAPTIDSTSTGSVALTFVLTATDNVGRTGTDSVVVTVNNGPIAEAGANQTVTEGAAVALNGSASFDPPGPGGVTFAWVPIGSPTVALTNANTATPGFTAPAQAFNSSNTYTFQLTVTDTNGLTATDTVSVTVNDAAVGGNDPVANAGADATVNEAAGFVLQGSATDTDGGVLAFSWSQVGGTAVALANASTANASFTAPTVAANTALTFQLTVTDPTGRTDTDLVVVTVNNGPTANAGADQTVTEGAGVALNGTASTDVGGGITSFLWQQMGGTAVTLTGSGTASPTFTAPAIATIGGSDTLTFLLTVTDAGGLTSTDTVLVQVNDLAVGNNAPTANAGTDKTVNENAATSLTGSGSDPESGAISFSWTQTGGTSVTLSGANTAAPSFTAPDIPETNLASITLTFQLTVTDNVGRTDTDTVVVTVNNGPNANAGNDQAVTEGASVNLSGAASNDPGAGALTYAWVQIGGPTVTLVNANTVAPTFIAPTQAFDTSTQYTFRLTVTDGGNLSAVDTVVVTVNDIAIGNAPPVANAGNDFTVNEGASAGLNAGASSDPEASALTFLWAQTAGTSVTLTGATSATPSFTAPLIAATNVASTPLTFQVTVTDNVGRSTTDTVVVTVNNGPNANAGPDQSVTEGATVNLTGLGSNDNGGALAYSWSQLSGGAVTLTGASTATPSFTAPAQPFDTTGTYVFRLTVTDAGGLTSTDTVNITVNDIAIGNAAPSASAGADQRVNEGASVSLSGSGMDPEMGALSFQWVRIAGPAVSITGATTATPSFTAPTIADTVTASATVTLQLTVTDNVGRTGTDTVNVVVNNGPNASAGPDQTVLDTTTTVTLNGSGSNDPGAGAITYEWVQVSGTPVTLSSPSAASPSFTPPDVATEETLRFRLTVRDADNASAIDTVDIIVRDPAFGNAAPTVDAGVDRRVNEGTAVSLAGTAADLEAQPLTLLWTQVGGPAVMLTGASTTTPSFTAPVIASTTTESVTLTFQLSATDNVDQTTVDTVTITVNNGPNASAGTDLTRIEGEAVTLDASASTDPVDNPVSFAWVQVGTPAVTLTGATTANPTFTAPEVATVAGSQVLTFQVTVTDADGLTATDTVVVTVNDIAVGNAPPTADAGADQRVNEGANAMLAGAGTDPVVMGPVTLQWVQTGGTAVTLSDDSIQSPTFVAPTIAGSATASEVLTFQLTVTDNVGLTAVDTVTITVNNGPNANAGPDQPNVLENTLATLDGSASNDHGDAGLTYAWVQLSGTTVTLANAGTAMPTFTAPEQPFDTTEVLTFRLTVTDADGLASTDTVAVSVVDEAANNLAPTASAGADRRANEGATVALEGSGTDPENATLSFSWAQTGGTAVTLANPATATPSFTAPTIDNATTASLALTFEVTVTDDVGRTATDTVVITINNGPNANAGGDLTVTELAAVALNGGASADPGAGPLTYLWTQTAGPAVTLTGGNTATPSFTAPEVATLGGNVALAFTLTVTDADGLTASDSVGVTVNDAAVGNAPPTVDAGADQLVNEGAAASLTATATDPENQAVTFTWTQTGGTAVTLTGASSATPSFTAPVIADAGVASITLTFSVTARDNVGLTATDTVQVTVNNAPIAVAGADQRVQEGTGVSLDGSASLDPGAGAITHAWTQVGGTAVTIVGANTATPSFTAPEVAFDTSEVLTFELRVTDANGASSVDTLQVTVDDLAIGNLAPTATAGADQQVPEGANVTLTGDGTDPESATLTFAWVQTGGAAVTLSDASAPTPTFVAPVIAGFAAAGETLTFQLTVTDDVGRSHTDTVQVLVDNGPQANAGTDATVIENVTVALDGSASADAGGGSVTYAWTQAGGPAVTLTGASTAAPTFTAPDVALDTSVTLTFTLTVTDAIGQVATDSVTITVNDTALGNLPPTVSAGADQRVNEGATAGLAGSATDPESGALTFAWVQVSGPSVTLSDAGIATPTFTAPVITDQAQATMTLVFELQVTDNVGRSATDQVTVVVNNGPLAAAGDDATTLENTAVALDGAASADAGGGSVGFAWVQVGGPAVTLAGANTATPSFTAPAIAEVGASATLTFTLTVTDADGLANTDTVLVQVDDVAVGNDAPTAEAGDDQRLNEGAAAALAGTATDPEAATLTFAWTQTGGTPVTLVGANTATPSFTVPLYDDGVLPEALVFTLTVTDDVGRTATDTVRVAPNNAATANAGPDADASESTLVQLDGSGSADPDGLITSHAWSQVSGPAVTLNNAGSANASFVAPEVPPGGATLVFRLTVRDDGPAGGLASSDEVTITVRNVNSPPIARAGLGVSVNEGASVALDGSGSSDPDGSPLAYAWQQVDDAAPRVVLTGAATANVSFTAPEVPAGGGLLTFSLTVTDADGETSVDEVQVTVNNVNRAPIVDAGPDQRIGEGVLARLSAANSTDDDGVLTYSWQQTGGTVVTLSDAAAVSPTFTTPRVPVGGEALTFTLRVTDQEGLAREDTVIVNVSDVNTPPVAAAGADASVTESTLVILDGTNSADPDAPQGSIVAFSWRQTAGPTVTIVDGNTATARFRAPLVSPAGTSLTFELTVTDDAGAMATDTVVVNVTNVNQAPVANAGADQSVREAVVVTLDGSNSLDVDAPVTTYRWRQTAGTAVTLSDPAAAQPTFTAPLVGANQALTFELTVTDDGGLASTDTVVVNVIDVGGVAPVANAGTDQDVTEGSSVLLDASASTDADGSIARFRWRQTSGITATLSDPNIAAPSFTAPLVPAEGGALVFEVTVTDDSGLSATDTVIVNVGNLGAIPVARAGADQSVQEGATVTVDGSASSDTGGSIVTFAWTQLSGPAVTLSNASTARPTFVAPAVSVAQSGVQVVLQLTVTDDDGAMASDSVAVRINDNGITGFPDTVVTIRTTSNDSVGVQPQSGNLVLLQAVDPDSIADQRNRPTRLDFDLISTHVRVPVAGATVEVTYFLAEAAPAGATWVKYVPSQGWIDFGANARFSADRRQVTITLTDGGTGDDDGVANGIIVDPAGLGSFSRDTGTPGAGNGGFASSDAGGGGRFGCSLGRDDGGVDASLVLLGLLALGYLGRRRAWRAA